MAVNGQLAFPNAAAAKVGAQSFARTINRIDLTWGDDLRVDPLAAELAGRRSVVARDPGR